MRETIDLIRDETMRAHVARVYDATIAAGPRGTMRAWFAAHDGDDVHTLQGGPRPWMPGLRVVDASRATYMTMNGSRRYYAGCRVVGATDDALIVTDSGGTPIIYFTG